MLLTEDAIRGIVRLALPNQKTKAAAIEFVSPIAQGDEALLLLIRRIVDEEFEDLVAVHLVPPSQAADSADGHLWYRGPGNSDRPDDRWEYFLEQMKSSGRSEQEIDRVDRDSTKILARTPSPTVEGGASGRGLALGYVQSGKTTNFMALAAKAADAGYRFVIVLSGVTNNLRNQTQAELEKYVSPFNNDLNWFWLTKLERDFLSASHAPAVENVFGNYGNVAVCVVKKNKSKLEALVEWFEGLSTAQRAELPVLIIDDECDQASINGLAAKQMNVRATSIEEEIEIRRTTINKLIVKLIGTSVSPRSAYVGYSATPFSNLLLDPNDSEDLYPRDFVYSLEKGTGYFGPEEIFGRDPVDESEQASSGLDIFNDIDPENIELLGTAYNSKSEMAPELIPELRSAVIWFIVSSAIRQLRLGSKTWTTMLIHTSQRISCHASMKQLITDFVRELRNMNASALGSVFESSLDSERSKLEASPFRGVVPEDDVILAKAFEVLTDLEIIVDNSESTDRLNYETISGSEERPVLVIGGNTLSRGLVLRGLISTFFLRTARGYDALLQMGRWFGYRVGWADLPRIWMTSEMQESFRFLALVEEEIRQQIGMYAADRNPLEIGVRIRCHPKLQVTSRGLGRVARHIGLSGLRVETILFPRNDAEFLAENIAVGKSFVEQIVAEPLTTVIPDRSLVRDVPVRHILDLLDHYKFADDARVAERSVLKKYIEEIHRKSAEFGLDELSHWDVFLYRLKGRHPRLEEFAEGMMISKITRSARQTAALNPIADLHHLSSQIDIAESIEADALESYLATNARVKSQIKYAEWPVLKRDVFGERGRGLMGIYLVDKDSRATSAKKKDLEAEEDLLGLTFFFPLSELSAGEIDYVAPPEFVGNIDPEDLESPVLEDASDLIDEIDSEDVLPEDPDD